MRVYLFISENSGVLLNCLLLVVGRSLKNMILLLLNAWLGWNMNALKFNIWRFAPCTFALYIADQYQFVTKTFGVMIRFVMDGLVLAWFGGLLRYHFSGSKNQNIGHRDEEIVEFYLYYPNTFTFCWTAWIETKIRTIQYDTPPSKIIIHKYILSFKSANVCY